MKYLKQYPAVLFGLFIVAYFFMNRYEEVSFSGTYSIHQWRQADCYSLALNYYNNDFPFFKPEAHFREFNGTGRSVSEFPIIYYTVAKLWKLFGLYPAVFRLFNFTILVCGLYCLFSLCNGLFNRPFLALFITGITASSPIVCFYGNNFIPDAQAMALCYCGWYFFYLFYKSGRQFFFFISALILLLAALIKITALITILIIAFLWLLELTGLLKLKAGTHKLFNKPVLHGITFLLVLGIVFGWVQYVKYYNGQNRPGIFMTKIMPVWEASTAHRSSIYDAFFTRLIFQFHGWPVLLTMAILVLFSMILARKNHPVIRIVFFGMLAGFAAFVTLFFQMLDIHDYYLAVWVALIPVTFISAFFILDKLSPGLLRSKWVGAGLAILFIHSVYYGAALTRAKYFTNDFFSNEYLTFKKVDQPLHNWSHWNYNRTLRACETVAPYLRSIGISPSDKIISMPDQSPNISLSLMNQPGFSDISCNNPLEEACIEDLIERGAKYLVINDPEIFGNRPFLKKFLLHKVGQYKNIEIFDLTPYQKVPVL